MPSGKFGRTNEDFTQEHALDLIKSSNMQDYEED